MRHGFRLLPVTLGASVVMAIGAASAQAYIYWAIGGPHGSGGTTIARAANDGSGINRSFGTGASNPASLVVSGNFVYWANDGTSSIGRANLNGSDADPTFIPNLAHTAAGIAVDGSYIYWTDGEQYIGRATIGGTDVHQTFIRRSSTSERTRPRSGSRCRRARSTSAPRTRFGPYRQRAAPSPR